MLVKQGSIWLCVLFGMAITARHACSIDSEPDTSAFVGVDILPMVRREILRDYTVIVADGRIRELGVRSFVVVPEDATVIDGKGCFLMPGLVDMHVHTWHEEELTLFLANGVTTIRNMFGSPMHVKWRDEIAERKRAGPTIYTAGPIVDGKPAYWPSSREIETPEDARQAVREHVDGKYDFIKVYGGIPPDAYSALVTSAKQAGLAVDGHVPV